VKLLHDIVCSWDWAGRIPLFHDLRNDLIQRFLIEDIISHSPVLRTPQEAEAIEGIGEPFSAYTLCEHSKQILGHQRAPDLVSVFARCTSPNST